MTAVWNWKSAVLSALLRSPIFVAAALQTGPRAAVAAGLTDAAFRLTISGLAGAQIQHLAALRVRWAAILGASVGIPLGVQMAEVLVHFSAATPHWTDAARVSALVSAVSALFNLYAMRRGALVAGARGRPLADDLRRLPGLAVGFLRRPFGP